jgi:hypothetical protein
LLIPIFRILPLKLKFATEPVTLVDVEVVRFLGGCEAAGITILHGPPYIREWISRELRQE